LFGPNHGIEKLKQALKKGYDYTGNTLLESKKFTNLLGGMLEYDPERRMQPTEILESEFICSHE